MRSKLSIACAEKKEFIIERVAMKNDTVNCRIYESTKVSTNKCFE